MIVQERLAIVSTLMLAVSTHSLSFRLPTNSADFLEGLYFLSISTSFLSFLLALYCSVSASILARRSQKDLLNFWVRPPFEEMFCAVDDTAEKQSAEQFEKTAWSNVFRLPGYSILQPKIEQDLQELRRRARFSHLQMQVDEKEDPGSLGSLMLRHSNHERTLQQLQNLWGDLAAYTPYFLLWGMRSLLSSFSFYALSQYFIDGLSFGYIVHFFYLILVLGMSALSESMMRTNKFLTVVERFLLLVDHASAFAATSHARRAATTWSEREGLSGYSGIFIVACYAAQCGVCLVQHYRFVTSTNGGSIIETLLETNANDVNEDWSGSDTETDSIDNGVGQLRSSASTVSVGATTTDELCREQSRMRDAVRTVCVFGAATIVLAWMLNAFTMGLFVTRMVAPPFQHAALHYRALWHARHLEALPSEPEAAVDVLLCSGEVHKALRLPGSKTVGELLTMAGVEASPWQPFASSPGARDATGARVGHEVPLHTLTKLSEKNQSLELHVFRDSAFR